MLKNQFIQIYTIYTNTNYTCSICLPIFHCCKCCTVQLRLCVLFGCDPRVWGYVFIERNLKIVPIFADLAIRCHDGVHFVPKSPNHLNLLGVNENTTVLDLIIFGCGLNIFRYFRE